MQSLCAFFTRNLKKYVEFKKIVDFFNIKSNEVLRNVKTPWISMLFQTKCIYYEYKFMKNAIKSANNDVVTKTLGSLCDVGFHFNAPMYLIV